jgi:predicted lipoprotein with Yx(FWY)xxD motif
MLVDETPARWLMGMQGTPFGAIVRTDMTYQLTYDGWPLYSFARDMVPGDVNGEGLSGFGGQWSIVHIDPATLGSGVEP